MDLKIDFDSEEVASKLKEAIMSSTFEAMFKKAVEEEISSLTKSNGWGSMDTGVRNLIRSFIQNQCTEVLKERKDEITALIRVKFEEQKLEELAGRFIDKIRVDNSY